MIFNRPCGIIFHGKRKDFSEIRAQTDRLKALISAEQMMLYNKTCPHAQKNILKSGG